jgi:phosphoglycolate phosphatase-like HAD superfamily hydrolase
VVKERGFKVPRFEHYCRWVNDPESLLSNDGLAQAVENAQSEETRKELEHCLRWSKRVNEMVAEIVKGAPPFMYVRESLEKVSQKADIIVCSATPGEALKREWTEYGLAKYVKVIAGQEMGTKMQHLSFVSNGKYPKDKIIMLGDAPGDMKAAKANDVLFYSVNPGDEDNSWKRFHDEAFDKFINGEYAGDYEDKVIEKFDKCLPEHPSW